PLDLVRRVDVVAQAGDLVLRQVAHLRVRRQAERGADLLRGRLADAVDVGQPDLEPLLVRQIHSGDACQCSPLPALSQPWRCLWRGLVQMTMVRPCRLITRQRSHMGLTDGRTFIDSSLYLRG